LLGRSDGVDGWHSLRDYPDARELPGIKVFRWEAPLFFANCGAFRAEVRRIVRRDQPRWVVVQCEAITDVDVTAADMLTQLDNELNGAGIHMAFVEMRTRIRDHVGRYGLYETLDRDHFYPTIETAIAAIRAEDGDAPA
jgi:MFS superfamily sulfate permease-like transporter